MDPALAASTAAMASICGPKKKFTPDKAKQRAKDYAKDRAAKATGTTTSIGKIPIKVRTAWEQKGQPEGNLKVYMLKTFWNEIISSPAEARASASLAESEAAVKNPVVEPGKEASAATVTRTPSLAFTLLAT